MPYKTNLDLPLPIQHHLPNHAQDIYREAFNHAYKEYADPVKRRDENESLEEVSHRVAWNSVKKKYKKGNDSQWYLKRSGTTDK
jgi:cation transport regulator